MARKWIEEGADDGKHPSIDSTARFAVDALLRSKGFSIAYRPRRGEAIWIRKDRRGREVRYKQSEALKLLDANDVADACYLEDLYGNR